MFSSTPAVVSVAQPLRNGMGVVSVGRESSWWGSAPRFGGQLCLLHLAVERGKEIWKELAGPPPQLWARPQGPQRALGRALVFYPPAVGPSYLILGPSHFSEAGWGQVSGHLALNCDSRSCEHRLLCTVASDSI